jgi:hypothetical protein
MRLTLEGRSMHIRNPDLDGPQALLAQSRMVLAYPSA